MQLEAFLALAAIVLVPAIQHLKKALGLKDLAALAFTTLVCVVLSAGWLYVQGQITLDLSQPPLEVVGSVLSLSLAVLGLATLMYRALFKPVDGAEVPEWFAQAEEIIILLGRVLGLELKRST